ncbi:fumarylacetoacetate hydrolase family protein [Streptomyces sp. NPDC048508]|uniref:fumarylacetoacetate hydrolase family protein n=1 Tax=Streptomyces sp. NPDC048508 TaxID=3365561 RepID=UPI00371FBA82
MRFATYASGQGSSVGLVFGDRIVDLNQWSDRPAGSTAWLPDVAAVFSDEAVMAALTSVTADAAALDLASQRLMPPVLHPSKVIGVGINYRSFARQLGEPEPEHLSVFHKTASALNAHSSPIVRPLNTRQLVPEGELALIIGRRARRVKADEGFSHIGVVTCANDVSARDLEFQTTQWTAGKMLPTSCPLGPLAVTPDEVGLNAGLTVTTCVNGVEVQRGHTSDMVFPLGTLVAALSELVDLEVGDVILSGTPSDLGELRTPVFLKPGDVVTVEIEGIGRLRNPVRDSDDY